jgi:hypothetical protein
MLVEFLDGFMQGESSNISVVEENLEAANAEQTYVSDPQAVQNMIEDGEAGVFKFGNQYSFLSQATCCWSASVRTPI